MLRKIYTCVLLTTLLFTACNKDEGTELIAPYQPIPAQSEMGNLKNRSMATSDKDNIYFYHFDSEGLKLYAKNRESGKLTVLDAITNPTTGSGEMMFTHLYSHGGYLYYSPFDLNGDRQNTIWRAKTDGSVKHEVVAIRTYSIMYYKDKIYYISNAGLFSTNMDGSGSVKVLDKAIQIAFNDDDMYYQTYKSENNELTITLHRSSLDGIGDQELAQFDGLLTFTFGVDRIYAMTGSGNACSLFEMNADGANKKEIFSSLPYATFATYGNTLFLAISEGNSRYKAGLYKYQPGYKMLMPVLSDPCSSFYFIGDNKIIYGNNNDKVGRFPQLYQTDFTGSKGVKLFN